MSGVIWRWLYRLTNPSALYRIEELANRVMVLEAALRRYGCHLPSCPLAYRWSLDPQQHRPAWTEGDFDAGCTQQLCGLAVTIEPHRAGHDPLGHIG